jgi:hypothetical protein
MDEAIEIEPRKADRQMDVPLGKVVVTQSRF